MKIVLYILKKHSLFAKLSNCDFMKNNIEYLGHVIRDDGIQLNRKKIEAVKDWEAPQNMKQVQSFLGLSNYYRRFEKDFATIATPLTNLTRKDIPFQWRQTEEKAFELLKKKLTEAPVLRCADPSLPYQLTSDASETGVGAVLTQTDDSRCRPIAYASRKLNPAEQGYSTHERELLAIIYALQTWKPYLYGGKFTIMTDRHPLKYLDTQKTLSRRQARWVEFMQEFDYEISYIKGKSNIVADALPRQDNEVHKKSTEFIRQLKHTTAVNIEDILLKKISDEYETDSPFRNVFKNPTEPYKRMGYRPYVNDKLCIPNGNIKKTISNDNHESLLGAHRGYKKTLSLISRYLYWPNMKKELKEYVDSCQRCQEAKSRNRKQLGLLRPFPPPTRKSEEIAMDFIFELPRTKDNKTGIMLVVDKLSKRTHFIPMESKHDAERTADTFYREIYKHRGLPRKIIYDRDSRFTGNFWSELMKLPKVKLNLSTAFHPQTDGPSERAF